MKHWFMKVMLFGVLPVALLAAGWLWLTLQYVYSDGERAGYVQKFSRKGLVCKTWEGQLSMINYPGAAPETFSFTVRDEAMARAINAAVGKRVALHYEQHIGIPSSCFGETSYFVIAVRAIE